MGANASSRFTLDGNLGVRSANSELVAFSTVVDTRRPVVHAKLGTLGHAGAVGFDSYVSDVVKTD
jgi:hypothetical protein